MANPNLLELSSRGIPLREDARLADVEHLVWPPGFALYVKLKLDLSMRFDRCVSIDKPQHHRERAV